MARPTSLGIKVGARKVDCEKYMPEPGDWEETNVIWDFGDGWLICEDRTPYDRKLMAKLTLTCLGSGEVYDRLWPGEVKDDAYWERIAQEERNKAEKSYDGKYYRNLWGDKWAEHVEKQVQTSITSRKRIKLTPIYRLFHVRDKKQRPRAAILLAMADYADGKTISNGEYFGYLKSRDLGQKHPILLDDIEWHVLECRIGTGNSAPAAVMARVCEWYAETTRQWDEKAYRAVKPAPYGKVTYGHASAKELAKLRKAA